MSRKKKFGVILLAFIIYSQFGESPTEASTFTKFEQLTEQSGEELFPDISPDGNYITYTKTVDEVQHIFLQRIGGGNAIVFRSERDGGGLFVMGSTGESIRRLTNFGYNPSWSPDSKKIIFAREIVMLHGGQIDIRRFVLFETRDKFSEMNIDIG